MSNFTPITFNSSLHLKDFCHQGAKNSAGKIKAGQLINMHTAMAGYPSPTKYYSFLDGQGNREVNFNYNQDIKAMDVYLMPRYKGDELEKLVFSTTNPDELSDFVKVMVESSRWCGHAFYEQLCHIAHTAIESIDGCDLAEAVEEYFDELVESDILDGDAIQVLINELSASDDVENCMNFFTISYQEMFDRDYGGDEDPRSLDFCMKRDMIADMLVNLINESFAILEDRNATLHEQIDNCADNVAQGVLLRNLMKVQMEKVKLPFLLSCALESGELIADVV